MSDKVESSLNLQNAIAVKFWLVALLWLPGLFFLLGFLEGAILRYNINTGFFSFEPLFGDSMVFASILVLYLLLIFKFSPYWKRNVVGYTAYFWADEAGEIQTAIHPRSSLVINLPVPSRGMVLVVPLGGWFHPKGYVLFNNGVVTGRHFVGWSRLNGWTIKRPRNFLEFPDIPQVTLLDREDQRLTTSVVTALLFFKHYSEGGGAFEWCTRLQMILSDLFQVRVENRKFQEHYEEAAGTRQALRRLVGKTIARLDGTRRFIQSKEAKELREWLASELERILSPETKQAGETPTTSDNT